MVSHRGEVQTVMEEMKRYIIKYMNKIILITYLNCPHTVSSVWFMNKAHIFIHRIQNDAANPSEYETKDKDP